MYSAINSILILIHRYTLLYMSDILKKKYTKRISTKNKRSAKESKAENLKKQSKQTKKRVPLLGLFKRIDSLKRIKLLFTHWYLHLNLIYLCMCVCKRQHNVKEMAQRKEGTNVCELYTELDNIICIPITHSLRKSETYFSNISKKTKKNAMHILKD